MTIRLFRVGNQPDAMYMSGDGKIQLAIRDDHERFEDLPLLMQVSLQWEPLATTDQAFLSGLAEEWAAREAS